MSGPVAARQAHEPAVLVQFRGFRGLRRSRYSQALDGKYPAQTKQYDPSFHLQTTMVQSRSGIDLPSLRYDHVSQLAGGLTSGFSRPEARSQVRHVPLVWELTAVRRRRLIASNVAVLAPAAASSCCRGGSTRIALHPGPDCPMPEDSHRSRREPDPVAPVFELREDGVVVVACEVVTLEVVKASQRALPSVAPVTASP